MSRWSTETTLEIRVPDRCSAVPDPNSPYSQIAPRARNARSRRHSTNSGMCSRWAPACAVFTATTKTTLDAIEMPFGAVPANETVEFGAGGSVPYSPLAENRAESERGGTANDDEVAAMSSTAWPVDLYTVTASDDGRPTPVPRTVPSSVAVAGSRPCSSTAPAGGGWTRHRRFDDEEAPFDRRRGEFPARTH